MYTIAYDESYNKYLLKINTSNSLEWASLVDIYDVWTTPSYYDGKLYIWYPDGTNWIHTLFIYDATTGSLLNRISSGSGASNVTSPSFNYDTGKFFLFTDGESGFFTYDVNTEILEFISSSIDCTSDGVPAIAKDGSIWFSPDGGGKFVGLLPDGTVAFSYDSGTGDTSPAIADDGSIYYVRSSSSQLFKFK